jgi:hypothetical protein
MFETSLHANNIQDGFNHTFLTAFKMVFSHNMISSQYIGNANPNYRTSEVLVSSKLHTLL